MDAENQASKTGTFCIYLPGKYHVTSEGGWKMSLRLFSVGYVKFAFCGGCIRICIFKHGYIGLVPFPVIVENEGL